MRFIATPLFTRVLLERLDDEEYRALQMAFLQRPVLGSIIPQSGGLRMLARLVHEEFG
jgi:hypothetical protein